MQEVINAILHYKDHPVAFVEEIVGATLDELQKDILEALVEHHFIAIRSGSGIGKTFVLSMATLWFLFTRPKGKVPTTAPSQHQLYDVLWAEHYKWIDRSPILGKFFAWTQTRLAVKGHEPHWFAVARTAQVRPGSEVAEGLQGFHDEENILFLIDESSGVPDAIYPAVEGALTTEGAYCILAGNPTRKEGFFFDIFNNALMAKYYHHIHVSSEDSPRVSKRWLEMMKVRYGEDHPIYQIKVKGEFPTAGEALLIPPSYLDEMENNKPNDVKGFPIEFGLDVGRSNAASVLCIRQGLNVLKWDERRKKGRVTDTNEICGWVVGYINEFDPSAVKVDAIGIGAGVYDNLKLIYGNMIVAVIGSQSAEDEFRDRYLNLRAQGYWELREKIPHIYGKTWPDRVISELGNIHTKSTTNAKIKIESKEEMLARSMKSPDYADAMYEAFLSPEACTGVKVVVFVPLREDLMKADKDFKKTPIWQIDRSERRYGREPGSRWKGFDA